MTNEPTFIYFLLGTLQLIGISLTGWALLTLVKVLQRIASLEGKFDAFPVQQIANNRHRVEQLEKHQEIVDHRLTGLEQAVDAIRNFCGQRNNTNL